MIRNFKALGLALVAVFAMSAVASSATFASAGLFTSSVPAETPAGVTGGQIGTDTLTIGALPAITCGTSTISGAAVTAGPSTTYIKVAPTYETCHLVAPLIGTRNVTITVNGCTHTFNATKNTNSAAAPTPGILTPFSADLHITCPVGQKIEIHVYNTANHNDVGAATLCTYDIGSQTVLNQIQLTNNTTPVPDDIHVDEHTRVTLTNTTPGGICSNDANPVGIYKATDTIQATNAGVPVNTTVS